MLAAWEPGLQEQSGVTSLASRVGWSVAAAASAMGGCAAAGLKTGPGAQSEVRGPMVLLWPSVAAGLAR